MLVEESSLVKDYDQMIDLAEKCREDREVYMEMSNKGKIKASDLMNTKKYLKKMYDDIIQNPLFK